MSSFQEAFISYDFHNTPSNSFTNWRTIGPTTWPLGTFLIQTTKEWKAHWALSWPSGTLTNKYRVRKMTEVLGPPWESHEQAWLRECGIFCRKLLLTLLIKNLTSKRNMDISRLCFSPRSFYLQLWTQLHSGGNDPPKNEMKRYRKI